MMSMTNRNPDTGIRYGIISSNSLNQDVICDLQAWGKDLHFEEACANLRRSIDRDMDILAEDKEDEYESQLEELSDNFYDDEPVHEFQRDGVMGRTTWLGGALLVLVFHSQWTTHANLCSPCVPNCGNLDSLSPDGYECYDVNPEWKISND